MHGWTMVWSWLMAVDLAGATEPQHAFEYEATPAVLYIPVDSIPIVPASICPIPQGGGDNSALGCVGGLADEQDYEPPANVMTIVDGVEAALAPYHVRVTTERPPAYVPYMMLLPGDAIDMEATSRTCVSAGIDCDGVERNDVALTVGGTSNCTNPDPVQVALIAFGYMSGLENNDEPTDPMFYPPDFDAPSQTFVDACATLVPTLDEEGMPNLPACVSAYHETHCGGVDGSINSDLELRGVYGDGPPPVDVTPPVVVAVGLDGDMEVPSGTPLPLSATIEDDSGLVFVRWTLRSDNGVLDGVDEDGDGAVCKGHNDVCEVEFGGAVPYYQDADGDYGAPEMTAVPDGVYDIVLEAADLAGNAIEPIEASIAVGVPGSSSESGTTEDPDPDSTGGTTTQASSDASTDPNDADADADDDDGDLDDEAGEDPGDGDDENGDDADSAEDDGGTTTSAGATDAVASRGCSCRTRGQDAGWLFVGLLALGLRTRRRRPR